MVLNLVVNAIQATDDGRPNSITIECRRDGPSALIRVRDTGKGIAPGSMKRLFEPYFAAHAAADGTGLGLPLARKIILSHGGAIDVASEEGVGTTFTVRLPALDPDAAAMAGRQSRSPRRRRRADRLALPALPPAPRLVDRAEGAGTRAASPGTRGRSCG